jgi:SpoVK/Ycf46/Vps4 family AAA+-type ATPase
MLAHSLSTSCPVSTISIKCPQLFKRYLGESEEAVRALFRHARTLTPCIVILDELDAATASRSLDQGAEQAHSVKARVLSALLNELDGVSSRGAGLIVIGCTSKPEALDSALIRPGRFDAVVRVELPDARDRAEIIAYRFRNTPCAAGFDTQVCVCVLGCLCVCVCVCVCMMAYMFRNTSCAAGFDAHVCVWVFSGLCVCVCVCVCV